MTWSLMTWSGNEFLILFSEKREINIYRKVPILACFLVKNRGVKMGTKQWVSDRSIWSQIYEILKNLLFVTKNSYGYNFALRHEVRFFICCLYIWLWIKNASDLQRVCFWATEFFYEDFWYFAIMGLLLRNRLEIVKTS